MEEKHIHKKVKNTNYIYGFSSQSSHHFKSRRKGRKVYPVVESKRNQQLHDEAHDRKHMQARVRLKAHTTTDGSRTTGQQL